MKRLKRILTVILIGVLTLGIMSLLSGCFGIKFGCYGSSESDTVPRYADPWKYKKEDQGFYYAVYSKEGKKTATILGLIDEELERDELVIPEKLGEYDVDMIGDVYQQLWVSDSYYGINAKNIKKIIINHEIMLSTNGILNFTGDLLINAKVMLWRLYDLEDVNKIQFNTDINLIEDYSILINVLTGERLSEIKFDAMGGEQTTYAIITKKENLIILERSPTRKNFIFDGWYRDKEYTTEWNFEEDKVTENTTLYAKWLAKEE